MTDELNQGVHPPTLVVAARKVDYLLAIIEELIANMPDASVVQSDGFEESLAKIIGDLDPMLFTTASERLSQSIHCSTKLEDLDKETIWRAFLKQVRQKTAV